MKILLIIFATLIGIGLSPVAFLLMPFLALATIIWGLSLMIRESSHFHRHFHHHSH
jgi:hypothetical protein